MVLGQDRPKYELQDMLQERKAKQLTGGGLRPRTVALKSSPACVGSGNESMAESSSTLRLNDFRRVLPFVSIIGSYGIIAPAFEFGRLSVSKLPEGLGLRLSDFCITQGRDLCKHEGYCEQWTLVTRTPEFTNNHKIYQNRKREDRNNKRGGREWIRM